MLKHHQTIWLKLGTKVTVKPRLHQGYMLPGNMLPERTTCCRQHICWRQHVAPQHVARQQVARSGNMLPVSRQHNYCSFMSRSTCTPLNPATDGQQSGNNFIADNKQHVDGNRTHVAGKLATCCRATCCPGVNAALLRRWGNSTSPILAKLKTTLQNSALLATSRHTTVKTLVHAKSFAQCGPPTLYRQTWRVRQ